MTTVRLRGIYATALTALLEDEYEIVQASPPIKSRFDRAFGDAPAAVTIGDAADRTGIAVVAPDDETLQPICAEITSVGVDAFSWTASTPPETVCTGTVESVERQGAVVDLGAAAGFLPFREADEQLQRGDELTVQVARTTAPWVDDRPELRTTIAVENSYGHLQKGTTATGDGIGVTDLLDVSPREGWTVRWAEGATDHSFDVLAAALSQLNERAKRIEDEVEKPTQPQKQMWVWFGRESRFALDEHRGTVTTTMDGHHRIKAGTDAASAAVDFTEAVSEPTGDFPFAETVSAFGPAVGDSIEIAHGKPDGRCFSLGTATVTDRDDTTITVERTMSPGGSYDALGVKKEAGDVATTKLTEGKWWYPTVYRDRNGTSKGTYVNVCTPVELFPDQARYIDLHVDVVKHADGTLKRVDDDELEAAQAAGQLTEQVADRARTVAVSLERALSDD
ncbi:DUF402 domain-containing protein [Halocatena halophila]|uniref:DUF402 domain-containing protein n=1 Tax=Halocatena halophila TaxID=2814576 RepID=UPI002ED32121